MLVVAQHARDKRPHSRHGFGQIDRQERHVSPMTDAAYVAMLQLVREQLVDSLLPSRD